MPYGASSICAFLQQLIECDLHEDFERSVTRFSLRTQQRPLPAIEQEPCQRFGIRISRQFFLRDCLLYDRRDGVLPVREGGGNLLSQLRIRCRDLQTETTHHASGNLSLLTVELNQVGEVPLQTLEGGHLRSHQDSGGVFRLARCVPLQCSRGEVF